MTKYNTKEEIWKDVVDYKGIYEVSNFGNVRSVDRIITYKNGVKVPYKGELKSQVVDKYGYNYVSLYENQRHKQGMVHRMVAQAFIPNPEKMPQVNHIDGDKLNNSLENLEWVTPQENLAHAKETGLLEGVSGEGHYKSKLKESDVKETRERSKNGETYQSLADEFGVVKSTIGFIVNRQTWGHIK